MTKNDAVWRITTERLMDMRVTALEAACCIADSGEETLKRAQCYLSFLSDRAYIADGYLFEALADNDTEADRLKVKKP